MPFCSRSRSDVMRSISCMLMPRSSTAFCSARRSSSASFTSASSLSSSSRSTAMRVSYLSVRCTASALYSSNLTLSSSMILKWLSSTAGSGVDFSRSWISRSSRAFSASRICSSSRYLALARSKARAMPSTCGASTRSASSSVASSSMASQSR
ncbi:hypothetical protein VTK73DRAFT_359 [Phialemonium thermophilum]|uniref:Uncharacterized protein n=1 Tax=Phialemonium thermophilum TaxID=223376 RepID=A0ABR3VVH1_9PEZI